MPTMWSAIIIPCTHILVKVFSLSICFQGCTESPGLLLLDTPPTGARFVVEPFFWFSFYVDMGLTGRILLEVLLELNRVSKVRSCSY